ncbi:coiled-coil domain-containing protein 81-like [Grus americana]|uniref:coiled-coil domain-containing protein 81-like n=2 Tax=Grus americana TaxID=9117 RepID=UPI0024089157|nr:coiled-coil domain-containing protein 81-like [Grus americana]
MSPRCHNGSVTHRGIKGAAGRWVSHPGEVSRGRTEMSSDKTVPAKEQPVRVRQRKIDFWDGTEHTFIMPSITDEERTAIWDAVANYIQEQLLLQKGVRIATLGSFHVVPTWIRVGDEVVIIQRPVFRLARNLVVVHNLRDNKDYLPDNKELEALKYAKVADAASVSRQKVENCVQGTMSLLSYCLWKGENVALFLKDMGVLLIEGTRVQMKYYYEFLEKTSGKKSLEKAVFKVPWLLDMVVSPLVPVASLTFSGRIILFPEFEMQDVPKPPPRVLKISSQGPGEDKGMRRMKLPPLGQAGPSGFRFPAPPNSMNNETPLFWQITVPKKRKKSRVRRQPVSLENSSGKKRAVNSQSKSRCKSRGPTSAKPRRDEGAGGRGGGAGGRGGGAGGRGGEGEGGAERVVEKFLTDIATLKAAKAKPKYSWESSTFLTPIIAILSATSSETSLHEEPTSKVLLRPPPRPK